MTTWTPDTIRALCAHLDPERGQTVLARRLNVAHSTVWRWITGQSAPNPSAVQQIARIAQRARFRPLT